MGVSRSTVQRYCDRGILTLHRTVGGHRRILASDIESWLSRHGRKTDVAALESHPKASPRRLAELWLWGNQFELNHELNHVIVSKSSLESVLDNSIVPALDILNTQLKQGNLSMQVHQIACLRARQWLQRLSQSNQRLKRPGSFAIGVQVGSDPGELWAIMTSLVLNQTGVEAIYLGKQTNASVVTELCKTSAPDFLWVDYHGEHSVNSIVDHNQAMYRELPSNCRLIMMGKSLTSSLRRRMHYDCFAESMQQLVHFCKRNVPQRHQRQDAIRRPSYLMAANEKEPSSADQQRLDN